MNLHEPVAVAVALRLLLCPGRLARPRQACCACCGVLARTQPTLPRRRRWRRWAAALLGGVPRLLLWAPRWWSHLPLVAAAIFVQGRLDQDAGYLLFTGSIGVLTQ